MIADAMLPPPMNAIGGWEEKSKGAVMGASLSRSLAWPPSGVGFDKLGPNGTVPGLPPFALGLAKGPETRLGENGPQ